MVLVGKTGVGKSAAGNTILRRRAFDSQPSSSSLTSVCQKVTAEFEGQTLAVVDTPGLFDTKKTTNEVVTEVTRCISFSAPGPHVFLVVIQPNRFTAEEQKTVDLIQKVFGKNAGRYTIVLFTHGDDLEADGVSVEEFFRGNSALCNFISQCGGGHHVFNNRNKDPSQIRELQRKINLMVQRNGGSFYTSDMLKEAERAIKEKTEQIKKENPGIKPVEARRRAEGDNEFTRTVIASTALGGAAGVAVGVGAGVAAGVQAGATVGAVAGPVGAVAGALVGVAVAGISAAIKEGCVIQ